jgi:hypothetical protein
LLNNVPQILGGRGESRVPIAPAASRGNERNHTSVVTTGSTEHDPAFPARWFYGFLRDLPGVHDVLVTVIGAMQNIAANLTPAKGRQDHTTSPSALISFV